MSEDKVDNQDAQAEPRWADRADEFMTMFSKGATFTEELLSENNRLRHQLTSAEEKVNNTAMSPDEATRAWQLKYEGLEARYNELINRHNDVEQENVDFAKRYIEIEEENNNLANLYIASFQLHSTLNFREVIQIIQEIVINLIGAEEFAIYVHDDQAKQYMPAATEGIAIESLTSIPASSELGERFASHDVYIDEGIHSSDADQNRPLVVIPLRLTEEPVGAISIFGFLSQKEKIADVDRELFTLLAGHAATAIFSARLYAESERKLNTIQGFIDLITK